MRPHWTLDGVHPGWGDRPSIYGVVTRGAAASTELADLPDDDRALTGMAFRFVAGGLDGVAGRHGLGEVPGTAKDHASEVAQAIGRVLSAPSPGREVANLYHLLVMRSVLSYVDPLLERLASHPVDRVRLRELAVWLAINAPDREPVKLAVALLGVVGGTEDSQLLLVLGSHDAVRRTGLS
jgi:hypothetical protein